MNKLRLSIFLLLVSILLVACFDNGTSTEPMEEDSQLTDEEGEAIDEESSEENAVDPTEIDEFTQSPILDEQDLPSIEERLPNEPKLTNEIPADMLDYEIGTHGGTLDTITEQIDNDTNVFVMLNEPLINTPGILGEEFTPNILHDYEVTEDQQEFTFYMREGLKWSDGEPVTTEDVRFAIEDVLFNKEITSVFPTWLRSGANSDGNPLEFEVVDEFTFKITFDAPYGGFIASLSIQGWRGYQELLKPSHYLQQYHVDYTPLEELEPLIEEEGFDEGEWGNLFNQKDLSNFDLTSSLAIDYPVLTPWMMTSTSDSVVQYERNPYYFKVDQAGNQLPYIDSIRSYLVEDVEMAGIKIISGEVDFTRSNVSNSSMPLYRENEETGGYRTLLGDDHGSIPEIMFNLTYDDETWREVVRDVRFREAMSLAINRDEIIDVVFYGFAEPTTMMDTTYDVEEANRLLDEMGMEIGPDGYRLGPDGEPFTIPIEVGNHSTVFAPAAELVVEYWSDLDLDVSMRTIDGALWSTRNEANELPVTLHWTHTPLWYYGDWGQDTWAPLWNNWNTSGGEEGEEPPEEVKDFYRSLEKINTSSPEEARQAVEEMKQEMPDQLWYLSVIDSSSQPLIVSSDLRNIPEEGFVMATNFSAEQFFFEN